MIDFRLIETIFELLYTLTIVYSMGQSRLISRSIAFILLIAALTIIFTAPVRVYAQGIQLNFKRINNENGLSNSTIETIFQDSRGFMWFGTRDGLNRFDGYQMLSLIHISEPTRPY